MRVAQWELKVIKLKVERKKKSCRVCYKKTLSGLYQTLTGFFGIGLFKIPSSADIVVVVVLIVVVLIAITEILFPCVVCVVLTGTPIVVTGKTSYNIK